MYISLGILMLNNIKVKTLKCLIDEEAHVHKESNIKSNAELLAN